MTRNMFAGELVRVMFVRTCTRTDPWQHIHRGRKQYARALHPSDDASIRRLAYQPRIVGKGDSGVARTSRSV